MLDCVLFASSASDISGTRQTLINLSNFSRDGQGAGALRRVLKEKLREWDFFSLENRRLWEEQLIAVFQHLLKVIFERIKPGSSDVCGRKMRDSGHKLKREAPTVFTMKTVKRWSAWAREVIQSSCLKVHKTQLYKAMYSLI